MLLDGEVAGPFVIASVAGDGQESRVGFGANRSEAGGDPADIPGAVGVVQVLAGDVVEFGSVLEFAPIAGAGKAESGEVACATGAVTDPL